MIYHHSFGNHRLMKKILSVCVVLALICSISIPTFAEDTANSTESNSAQQPTLGITEGSLADENQNDTEAEESQVLDAQTADQNQDMSSEQVAEKGKQDQKNIIAAIYYLKNPTGDPLSNDTDQWAPEPDKTNLFASIDITGAKWVDGYGGEESVDGKNAVENVSSFIKSWPDGSTEDKWTVRKDDKTVSYFNDILASIWNTYKSSVAKELGINENDLKQDSITEITLTPRKISRNNGGNYPYHVDCALSIKSDQVFTAKFWVKNPGGSGYTKVDARNYTTGSKVEKTGEATTTKTVDGVTYVLDGWYAEDATGGAYGNKIADSAWPYSPTHDELNDGTVNFYAHYSPMYTSVTISKNVTGSMGDLNKSFHFEITVKNDGIDLPFIVDEQKYTGTAPIDLKNGESKTLVNVPVNATVTVTEDNYGTGNGGYTTSYKIDGADNVPGQSATIAKITAEENGHRIIFTNNKDVTPDTGLYLTSWPYLMMLALVTGGALVFFMRRRRRS